MAGLTFKTDRRYPSTCCSTSGCRAALLCGRCLWGRRSLIPALGADTQKDATKDEICKAYKQWALMYHPDKINERDVEGRAAARGGQWVPNCAGELLMPPRAAMMARINLAKEVLLDEQRRKIYDDLGEDGLKQLSQQRSAPCAWFGVISCFANAFLAARRRRSSLRSWRRHASRWGVAGGLCCHTILKKKAARDQQADGGGDAQRQLLLVLGCAGPVQVPDGQQSRRLTRCTVCEGWFTARYSGKKLMLPEVTSVSASNQFTHHVGPNTHLVFSGSVGNKINQPPAFLVHHNGAAQAMLHGTPGVQFGVDVQHEFSRESSVAVGAYLTGRDARLGLGAAMPLSWFVAGAPSTNVVRWNVGATTHEGGLRGAQVDGRAEVVRPLHVSADGQKSVLGVARINVAPHAPLLQLDLKATNERRTSIQASVGASFAQPHAPGAGMLEWLQPQLQLVYKKFDVLQIHLDASFGGGFGVGYDLIHQIDKVTKRGP